MRWQEKCNLVKFRHQFLWKDNTAYNIIKEYFTNNLRRTVKTFLFRPTSKWRIFSTPPPPPPMQCSSYASTSFSTQSMGEMRTAEIGFTTTRSRIRADLAKCIFTPNFLACPRMLWPGCTFPTENFVLPKGVGYGNWKVYTHDPWHYFVVFKPRAGTRPCP